MGLSEMILLAMFSVFGFGALWEMFEGSADSVEKEERPAIARRSTKERRKAKNTFRGEYTTRGRNNANTY